tara:strand:+ start:9379 stop:9771 length:393 start_codon:yes stop_codon:yes gene_type:complete
MKIYDNKNKLVSIVIKADEIKERTNFITNNEEEMQVASFNFSEETVIDNHIHLNQNRNINTTPEIIFVVEGKIKATLFDDEENLIDEIELTTGDTIAFLKGGHGLIAEKGTKLVEAKQGPYIEDLDKKRF